MIFIYFKNGKRVESGTLEQGQKIPAGTLWVDVRNPDENDLRVIEEQLGVQIPNKKEIWKNHVLNRLYMEDGIAYMTAALITKVDSPHPGTAAVTFILTPQLMLTVHDIDPTSFRNFANRLHKSCDPFPTPNHVLEGLLEEIITRVAYNSEIVVQTLDEISHDIFSEDVIGEKAKNTSQFMKSVLKRLGAAADLNSKINESLHSVNRLLVFFKQIVSRDEEVDANTDILITDSAALTTQSAFLSDKITFQLDALLGMINVEQNLIIKIFSVVTVFFLPPTLVSSIYGMNFEFMPELEMHFGYPVALGIMFLSALMPYLYFRKKNWL